MLTVRITRMTFLSRTYIFYICNNYINTKTLVLLSYSLGGWCKPTDSELLKLYICRSVGPILMISHQDFDGSFFKFQIHLFGRGQVQ